VFREEGAHLITSFLLSRTVRRGRASECDLPPHVVRSPHRPLVPWNHDDSHSPRAGMPSGGVAYRSHMPNMLALRAFSRAPRSGAYASHHGSRGLAGTGDDRQVTFVPSTSSYLTCIPMTTVTVMLGAVAMESLVMAIGGSDR
jgi:hypothetical protein